MGNDGQSWVVKVHGNPQGTKVLFNELISGRLACLLGISWPLVSPIELTGSAIDALNSHGVTVQSPFGVGIQFIPGLQPVPMPPGGYGDRTNFDERNRQHLSNLIPDVSHCSALYGKCVFDNWVLLQDCKYDTLCLDSAGQPMFLDASCAFGGLEWNEGALRFDDTHIDVQSPFLHGILDNLDGYRPWLERLDGLSQEILLETLKEIPAAWDVPRNYLDAMQSFLSQTSPIFVQQFRDWIAYQRYLTST